jgi:hypothetical protein
MICIYDIFLDEEVGGDNGMVPLLHSEVFKTMNVGVVLDEGGPAPVPMVGVLFQDKIVWRKCLLIPTLIPLSRVGTTCFSSFFHKDLVIIYTTGRLPDVNPP